MKKMMVEPVAGWLPVYQDLENCHSAIEFALAVYREVDRFLVGRAGSRGDRKSSLELWGAEYWRRFENAGNKPALERGADPLR